MRTMVSRDLDEWVHELRCRALVCRSEAESLGETTVVAHCDMVLARLDAVWVDRLSATVVPG